MMPADPFLQQLLSLPAVLHAWLWPDAGWIAFVWYRVHDNLDVFVVPSEGSVVLIALTRTPAARLLVGWTTDSRAVLVAEDHDSNERVRLFRVRLERPGEMEPLTEDRPAYFVRGGALHSCPGYIRHPVAKLS